MGEKSEEWAAATHFGFAGTQITRPLQRITGILALLWFKDPGSRVIIHDTQCVLVKSVRTHHLNRVWRPDRWVVGGTVWAVVLYHAGSAGMLAGDNREWESSDQLDCEYICTKSLEKKPYRLDREQQCPFIIRKYKSTRKRMDFVTGNGNASFIITIGSSLPHED